MKLIDIERYEPRNVHRFSAYHDYHAYHLMAMTKNEELPAMFPVSIEAL
jgi:hypothetical protein